MVGQPLAVAVMSVVLGTGTPGAPSGDPTIDEWELPPELPRQRPPAPEPPPAPPAPRARPRTLDRRVTSSFPPPDPRLERPQVIVPALVGLGLGLGSGIFYKLALDQRALLDSGRFQTRGEVYRAAQTGSSHQTVSVALGGAALASLGVSAFMFLTAPAPPKPAEPKVSFFAGPGGVVVGVSGVMP